MNPAWIIGGLAVSGAVSLFMGAFIKAGHGGDDIVQPDELNALRDASDAHAVIWENRSHDEQWELRHPKARP